MTNQPTSPFPLPPEFPDRAAFEREWCADLESGGIGQTTKQLRKGKRRCCLGVACDIAIRHGVGHWDGDCYVSPESVAKLRHLPDWLADHLGRSEYGALPDTDEPLSHLNDRGVPFPTIAGVMKGSVSYADAEKAAATP